MDMRTPLKKVRGLGSAKEGTHHFWMQRMTAVALVPLFVLFIIFIIAHIGAPYEEVVASLANPFIAVLMGLMIGGTVWIMGSLGDRMQQQAETAAAPDR